MRIRPYDRVCSEMSGFDVKDRGHARSARYNGLRAFPVEKRCIQAKER